MRAVSPGTGAARSSSPSRPRGVRGAATRQRVGTPVPDRALDKIFQATVEATEEAVLNALWGAVDTDGRDGHVARALPHDATLELLERHGRLERP